MRKMMLRLTSLTLVLVLALSYVTALAEKETTWHPDQSVCTMGPMFRNHNSKIGKKTNRWYMFTPMDLSEDGEYVLDMIAANMHYIGTCTVKVEGDAVTLSYEFLPNVTEQSMAFTFLPDLKSVEDVETIDRTKYQFGEPLSIQEDLKGDTRVLLSVLGWIGYDHLGKEYPKFNYHQKKYLQYCREVKKLMD